MRKSFGAVLALILSTGFATPATALSVGELSSPEVTQAAPATKAACTVKGTRRDDVLVGTRRNDVLCGRGGDDVLRGGAGDDVLQGDGGHDTLVAGPGDDALQGGPGTDRLRADGDTDYRDVLVCGGGKDKADADAEDRVKEGCEKLNQPRSPNRAPSGADRSLTILEDGSYSFAETDFGFTDPDSDSLLAVTLVTVPAVGSLDLDGAGVTSGQSIAAAAIPDLAFTPAADANGSPLASLTFVVQDDGGTSDGGLDTDQTPNTVTIDVTPVNDAPGFVAGPNQDGVANTGGDDQPKSYTVDPWASAISPGAGEDDQAVTFEVSTDNESLFTAQPAVSSAGVLTFTTDPGETGTAEVTLWLEDDGGTAEGGNDTSDPQTFTITTIESGPAITSISPSPLVPGGTATLTGREFNPSPAGNTVTIGGVSAPVTGASATTLTVTVPCVSSDPGIAVRASVDGTATNVVNHPLLVPQRDLDVGEATIIDDATKVGCNEIVSTGGVARYVIAAYNTSTSPGSSTGIRVSGDPAMEAPAMPPLELGSDTLDDGPASWVDIVNGEVGHDELVPAEDGDAHTVLLRKNRRQYDLLRKEFGTKGVQRPGVQHDTVASDMPLTRNFRVSNIAGNNICNSYYVRSGTRVYAEGKLVIYEDDATPTGLKAANNPAMAGYYDKIGDQFNADMEPVIRNNFGDVLLRDPVTDNNGVLVAFSTPLLNSAFPGVAGFVVSCDQFPNADTNQPAVGGPYPGSGANGASNFGEYFYLYQPTSTGTGYEDNTTADSWYRTVRSTFIHETKHVASMAARTANGAPLEVAWLEEGTARHAEELWARQSVYNVPWKGNTGYGTTASPNSIYCDVRPGPGYPECHADPRRPSMNMFRHFSSMYTYLASSNSALLSPFGATGHDNNSYWYATSWSLVRYAIDRYGGSDAAFLTALTQSSSTGVTNLMQQTPTTVGELLGRWALALAVDDYPGLVGASPDVTMPTWNFRDIYAGLNRDGLSSLPYPSDPTSFTFGSFAPVDVPTLYGGGVKLFQLSGTQTEAQLLRLQGNGGAALPSTIRLAIVRVQ